MALLAAESCGLRAAFVPLDCLAEWDGLLAANFPYPDDPGKLPHENYRLRGERLSDLGMGKGPPSGFVERLKERIPEAEDAIPVQMLPGSASLSDQLDREPRHSWPRQD